MSHNFEKIQAENEELKIESKKIKEVLKHIKSIEQQRVLEVEKQVREKYAKEKQELDGVT